jgi:N-acetylglucosaminyldiphosphoundecaprenol N-acetyl-beta-D-mannosaminyltransferase
MQIRWNFRPDEEPQVLEAIKSSQADCLFIGMPTLRKERFPARYGDQFGALFIMDVDDDWTSLSDTFGAPFRSR